MALTNKLTAIANSIRAKTGSTNKLTLDEMPTAISNISSGGDLPAEALNITGNCEQMFTNNHWNWFIDNYGNRVNTSDITSMHEMFRNSGNLQLIPFSINCSPTNTTNLWHTFFGCGKLKSIPQINNAKPAEMVSLFSGCQNVREIDDDMFKTWDFSDVNNSSKMIAQIFNDCKSLRKLPMSLVSNLISKGNSGLNIYSYYGFCMCVSLDEAVNLPLPSTESTNSDLFYNEFYRCFRLKRMTFKTNEDGTPLTANYSGSTIELNYVGFCDGPYGINDITNSNSGITKDKNVCYASDGTTKLTQLSDFQTRYNELKNDPDWFSSTDVNVTYNDSSINAAILFSRYNHDSAVETINSLPDTSAYGTNTIKFKNYSGALTDAGGTNDLTEAEIAVATAKGWTVTLV